MTAKACQNCAHYAAQGDQRLDNAGGECRRKAPRIAPDSAMYAARDVGPFGYWPVVTKNQWCGDFHASLRVRKANTQL